MKSIWKAIVSWFTRKEEPNYVWTAVYNEELSRSLIRFEQEMALTASIGTLMEQRDKAKRQKKKWTPIQREIEVLQAKLMKLEG